MTYTISWSKKAQKQLSKLDMEAKKKSGVPLTN